jgi:prolyl 4-hydroxylase
MQLDAAVKPVDWGRAACLWLREWHSRAMHPQLAKAFRLASMGHDEDAVTLIGALAQAGDREALFIMADMYWRGGGMVLHDHVRGRKLFTAAAKAGHPRAEPLVTNLMGSGIAGPRDWRTAMERLRYEARKNKQRAEAVALIEAMALTPNGDPKALPKPEPLSTAPHIVRYPAAFTPEECDYLIRAAEPGFAPSMVNNGALTVRDPIRTSDNSVMHWLIEDPAIHALNRRLAALTRTKPEQGEPLLILRYGPGQEYRRHYDWTGERNRRMQTALVYLNQGYGGGETEFSKVGLKVRGEPGDVLVFRNAGPDGKLDPLTEHAGLPVMGGIKYLASRWIRDLRHVP